MRPRRSKQSFIKYCRLAGKDVADMSCADAIRLMAGFYRDVRARGCDNDDGDMLLFQWGTYDWGHGESFQIDITRQFVRAGSTGDDGIMQLSLTLHYQPFPELKEVGSGERWCRTVRELHEFERFAADSPGCHAVSQMETERIELELTPV